MSFLPAIGMPRRRAQGIVPYSVRESLPGAFKSAPYSILIVATYLAGRDVAALSFESIGFLFAAAAVALLLLRVVEYGLAVLAAQRFGQSGHASKIASALVFVAAVGVPLAWGVWRSVELGDSAPWWLVAALLAGAVLATLELFVMRLLLSKHGVSTVGRVFHAAVLALGFTLVHAAVGTLGSVREGTLPLHLALFLGTWLVSAALVWLLGLRVGTANSKTPAYVCLGLVLLGVAFLEVDRRALPGLYEPVHAWLLWLGLLCLDAGVSAWLSAKAELANERWRWLPRAAFAVLVVAIATSALRWQRFEEADVRSELASTPSGATLLGVVPLGRGGGGGSVASHPALQFPRYLDRPWQEEPLNLLLITIDTLRADQLEDEAAAEDTSHLRALAQRGVRFTRAYAQGTRTAVAMGALMTGRYSANIDWELWAYKKGKLCSPRDPDFAEASVRGVFTTMPRRPKAGMLAERLKRAGYVTLATPFAGRNEFFAKRNGFDRGFSRFTDLTKKKWQAPSSERIVASAIRQLRANHERGKWFQWVHLYDPHEWSGNRERYGRLVRTTDEAVGKLLAELDALGERHKTAIFILADHGEGFGEHRGGRHGTSLYDEQARIPLLAIVPGVPARVETQPVAALDVTATLLSLAKASTKDIDGVNLLPLLQSREYPQSRPVFLEIHRFNAPGEGRSIDMKGLVLDDYKLLVDRGKNTASLFNLRADPGETKNLVTKAPAEFKRLSSILNAFIQPAELAHPLPE